MTQPFNENKEQVKELLETAISASYVLRVDFLEYAKRFYPKTAQAYLDWQNASVALGKAIADEKLDPRSST